MFIVLAILLGLFCGLIALSMISAIRAQAMVPIQKEAEINRILAARKARLEAALKATNQESITQVM